ncbi:MAG: type I 3-dehydroquinate dehydratase [Chthoniobacterales bacterium]
MSRSAKTARPRAKIVGVIFSRADLQRAIRMRRPPDLFELRLDAFVHLDELESALQKLRAPLIITARHPREGGVNSLSSKHRRRLLLRFLPFANYVDVELRSSSSFKSLLAAARAAHVRLILSFHDLAQTPSLAFLQEKMSTVRKLAPDIFKIATRVDAPVDLSRLLEFFDESASERFEIAGMGIGAQGRVARLVLARRGSALNYGHLGQAQAEGQMSIAQLRAALRKTRHLV